MAVFLAGPAAAMEAKIVDDQIIMSGKVDGGELPQLWNIAAERRSPPIRTVVLRDSPGGDLRTALQAGDFIREQGWNTAVSGYCFSACALMFLGGKERAFTDEKQPQLGFHGTYYTETALRETPGSLHIGGTIQARVWMKRATDGKISEGMLERFERLAKSDFIHFFDSARRRPGQVTAFVCPIVKDGKRKCEPIYGADVYREGIANSETVIRPNDRR